MGSLSLQEFITAATLIFLASNNAQIIEVNSSSLNYIAILSASGNELDWAQANAYCKSNHGTSLATVQNSIEWDEIYNLAATVDAMSGSQADGLYLYIGFRSNSNGNLVWSPCYSTNNDCTYDPCEANCDVYSDNWTGKNREGAFNTNGCGYITRGGASKTWHDAGCSNRRDFICNSALGKYKTDMSCNDTGLLDSEYTQEPGFDIQCGLDNHFPRVTGQPMIRINSSALNYIGIMFDAADELGWYYAQTFCQLNFGTSLATVQSHTNWNEIYDMAEVIDGIGGAQGDGAYLWIGFKSNSESNLVWAPCHDGVYDSCTYDPCEANCDAYSEDWLGKGHEATFDGDKCGYIQRGGNTKSWLDDNCATQRDFICNSPWGEYKTDISCVDSGLLDNEYTTKSGYDVACNNPITAPTLNPTGAPTFNPSDNPTYNPTPAPTKDPTNAPSFSPTISPSTSPFVPGDPTATPTDTTSNPTTDPSHHPTSDPTADPTTNPTLNPTSDPTTDPTNDPTNDPTIDPTIYPTVPSTSPTLAEGHVEHSTPNANDDGLGVEKDDKSAFAVLQKNLLLLIIGCSVCLLCCIVLCVMRNVKKKKASIKDKENTLDLERITSVSTNTGTLMTPTEGGQTQTQKQTETEMEAHVVAEVAMDNIEPFSNEQQIKMWLQNIGLVQYLDIFMHNGFQDGTQALFEITNDDLKDMGIEKVAHRKLILKQIKNNNKQIEMITIDGSGAIGGEVNNDDLMYGEMMHDHETDNGTDNNEDDLYAATHTNKTDDGYNENKDDQQDENEEESLDNIYQKPLNQTKNGDT